MDRVDEILILVMGLLFAVAAVAGLARRLTLSYPIVLVIFGLLCSIIPHVPRIPLPPSIVFLVFLPPLLYIAAWQTSWREFKYNLVSISSLAIFLVFFTAIGVAFAAKWWLPGFDWQLGFLLGAVVSPTDAVAATSIARKVGMPQQIVDILEGESLLNDATGLLALEFGLAMVAEGTTPTLVHGLLKFGWLTLGGIIIGLAIGFIVSWLERWIDDGPVEIAISLLVPYTTYLAAEGANASGVIATVACGLLVSRRSSSFFSPRVRLQAFAVWDALEFLLNGFVFVLMGLQLPYVMAGTREMPKTGLLAYGLVFSVILIALRMAWMFPASQAAWWVRTRIGHQKYDKPKANQTFVVGWTGMRGVVALAAASSLPLTLKDGSPFPERSLIIFLTFALILVTIVLQGLSLPLVIRLLRLSSGDTSYCEEGQARRLMLQAAMDFLQERRNSAQDESEIHLYDDLLHQFEHRITEVELCGPTGSISNNSATSLTMGQVVLETIRAEREKLNSLRQSGRLGDSVHRSLERELDLSESRLT